MSIFDKLFHPHPKETPTPTTGDEALVGAATISPTEAAIATPGTDLSLPEAEPTTPSTPVEEKIGSEVLELSNQIADTNTTVSTETFDIPESTVGSSENSTTSEVGAVDFNVLTPPPLTAEQASEAPAPASGMLSLPPTEQAPAVRTELNLP